MISFKGRWFEKEIILICVRWDLAFLFCQMNIAVDTFASCACREISKASKVE